MLLLSREGDSFKYVTCLLWVRCVHDVLWMAGETKKQAEKAKGNAQRKARKHTTIKARWQNTKKDLKRKGKQDGQVEACVPLEWSKGQGNVETQQALPLKTNKMLLFMMNN